MSPEERAPACTCCQWCGADSQGLYCAKFGDVQDARDESGHCGPDALHFEPESYDEA